MEVSPERSSEALQNVEVRLLGTGASAPTKVFGKGITVGRTGVGVYTLTFVESPGTWAGYTWGIDATTPANIKNHDVVVTATSTTVITVTLWDAAAAAHDLAAAEWINLTLKFVQVNA